MPIKTLGGKFPMFVLTGTYDRRYRFPIRPKFKQMDIFLTETVTLLKSSLRYFIKGQDNKLKPKITLKKNIKFKNMYVN